MSYYLVDFENVKKDGLDGIHKLGKEDRVCIFYSKNADSITFDQHRRIIESQAAIEFCKVEVGSKNALDFQLATQLGFLIANKSAEQYFIVSKDKGFEILSGYWKSRNVNVTLIADITGPTRPQPLAPVSLPTYDTALQSLSLPPQKQSWPLCHRPYSRTETYH